MLSKKIIFSLTVIILLFSITAPATYASHNTESCFATIDGAKVLVPSEVLAGKSILRQWFSGVSIYYLPTEETVWAENIWLVPTEGSCNVKFAPLLAFSKSPFSSPLPI